MACDGFGYIDESNCFFANIKEISAAVKAAVERRLFDLIQGDCMIRAREVFGRAFFRDLTELRMHHHRRMKMAVDVSLLPDL